MAGHKKFYRRVTKRREYPDAFEINVTPVMNLFVCLIPFLLLSAVFVEISIIETNAPSTSSSGVQKENTSLVMVVVNNSGFVITGSGPVMKGKKDSFKLNKKGDTYNLGALSQLLGDLKKADPKAEDLLIMSSPDIKYSLLIEVMDAARGPEEAILFPKAFFGGVTS